LQRSRDTRRNCSPFNSSAACGSSTHRGSSLTMGHIQGQESPVLLRNVVKPEDVDDPISVGRWALLRAHLLDLNSRPLLVEEILARAQTERLMTICDLPTFSSTLELLTMLALSTGHLLKASPITSPSFLSFKTETDFHSFRAVLPTSSSRRVKYSTTGTTKGSGSSPNHPCCMPRIYRLRFSEAAGKSLRAPREQATRRS